MGDYDGVRKGSLKFKGDKPVKKKKKKEKTKEVGRKEKEDDAASEVAEEEEAPVLPGSGRIVASRDIIHGLETKFKEEVAVGDSLIVQHPSTHQMESRLVTAILSQRSLNIHVGFSSDFSTTTAYHVKKDSIAMEKAAKKQSMKAGEDVAEEELIRQKMQKILDKRIKRQQKVVKVQEKVYGGGGVTYRSVEKKMDRAMGAEDALDERCKLGRDKYCW